MGPLPWGLSIDMSMLRNDIKASRPLFRELFLSEYDLCYQLEVYDSDTLPLCSSAEPLNNHSFT